MPGIMNFKDRNDGSESLNLALHFSFPKVFFRKMAHKQAFVNFYVYRAAAAAAAIAVAALYGCMALFNNEGKSDLNFPSFNYGFGHGISCNRGRTE